MDQRLEERKRKEQIHEARKDRNRKLRVVLQWSIVVIGLLIIAMQTPRLISVFKEEKPLRYGSYQTDAQTDQCIRNLWKIAKLLQENQLPGKNTVCPASKMPFVVAQEEGELVVRSPKPELYGFKEMRVSKERPVPQVIK
jgi:hypothetical protein